MRKKGARWTIAGLLLLAAALCLTLHNIRQDAAASARVRATMQRLAPALETAQSAQQSFDASSQTAFPAEAEVVPDYSLDPQREMPVKCVDGTEYIGYLQLPSISLELPVIGAWSDAASKLAPCRYAGTAYTGNFVIAGHNYKGHFRALKELQPGDLVVFTDMDGYPFSYEVVASEKLSSQAVDEMLDASWDLTLFTCTAGGENRLAVRCERLAAQDLNGS